MAFLSADRNTKEQQSPDAHYVHVLGKDSTQYYKGQIVAIDVADGKLEGATAGDLTQRPLGRCEENVLTGTSNTRKIRVKVGTFYYASGGTFEAITAAHIGLKAFVVDDQTVGKSGATAGNCVCGRITDVDAREGVAVKFDPWGSGLHGATAGG